MARPISGESQDDGCDEEPVYSGQRMVGAAVDCCMSQQCIHAVKRATRRLSRYVGTCANTGDGAQSCWRPESRGNHGAGALGCVVPAEDCLLRLQFRGPSSSRRTCERALGDRPPIDAGSAHASPGLARSATPQPFRQRPGKIDMTAIGCLRNP